MMTCTSQTQLQIESPSGSDAPSTTHQFTYFSPKVMSPQRESIVYNGLAQLKTTIGRGIQAYLKNHPDSDQFSPEIKTPKK
ncbi:hypothetical protein ABTD96_20455, partial [Acinetobacter baumannii]